MADCGSPKWQTNGRVGTRQTIISNRTRVKEIPKLRTVVEIVDFMGSRLGRKEIKERYRLPFWISEEVRIIVG